MKVRGNGQARVLSKDELDLLFGRLLDNPRNALLFAICFYTACRISEALTLEGSDIKSGFITFRKENTKGKLKTRTVPISEQLLKYFQFVGIPETGAIFPGRRGQREFMSRTHADRILRKAYKACGIEGASTHSFRRSSLTYMYRSGVPLRTIQEISGHHDLGVLQRYLEVDTEDLKKAIAFISL
jgi:integrase/recombinase XerD